MEQQLNSFGVFTQTKKSWNVYQLMSGLQNSGVISAKEPFMAQYNTDEHHFEDAHNAMINRLNKFRSLNTRDKIFQSA
jgi:hypothetical protein